MIDTMEDLETLTCETAGTPTDFTIDSLTERFEKLGEWPTSLADSATSPYCGCMEDGEGERCWWDDTTTLELIIGIMDEHAISQDDSFLANSDDERDAWLDEN